MAEDRMANALDDAEVDSVTSSIESGSFVAVVRKGSQTGEGRGATSDTAYAAAIKGLPRGAK